MRNFIKNPERFQSVKEIVEAFEKIYKPNFCDALPEVQKEIEILYLELKNKITKMQGGKRNKKSRKTRKNQKGGVSGVIDQRPLLAVMIVVFIIAYGFITSVRVKYDRRVLNDEQRARAEGVSVRSYGNYISNLPPPEGN
jgi:hypothetical protein